MNRDYRRRLKITSAADFADVCDDMITEFLETFDFESGLIRQPDADDLDDFEGLDISFIYTQKGMRLYNKYCERLHKIGSKYFDSDKLEIKSNYIIFP